MGVFCVLLGEVVSVDDVWLDIYWKVMIVLPNLLSGC